MVETITPVVHGGRRRWIGILALHVAGAAGGAAVVGALAGAAGGLVGAPWGAAGGWVVAGLAALYLLREAGLRVPLPQAGRQVPESWRRTMPPGLASFLYGAMLGTGYLTHLGHGTWLVVGVAAAATGRPLLGAALTLPFGLARGLALAVTARARIPEDSSRLIDRLEAFSRTGTERVANAAVLTALAGVAVWGTVAPGRAAAVVLAGVFAWAAGAKVVNPEGWRRTLDGYGLPTWVRRSARAGVPVAELAVAVLVLTGRPEAAAAMAVGLLAAFSAVILRIRRRRGDRLPCGCFGGSATRDYRVLLARNVALVALSLAASAGRPATSLVLPGAGEVLPATLTVAGGVLALVLVRRSVRLLGRG